MEKIPVIIDCDPGIDDIIGLVLAGRNERIDLRAVTVVGGNQTIEKVGNNALKVLSFLGVDVPVAFGMEEPLVRDLVIAAEVHGEDGMYGIELPEASLEASDLHAVDLMAEVLEASEEEVALVCMGPLTNVAFLLKRYPELKSKISKISLMGGAISGGNTTNSAEFNIYVDPEAASIVFNSGVPIIMSGLDITHQANIYEEDMERIRGIGNKVSDLVVEMLENLLVFHRSTGFNGCHMHDPVALLVLTHPGMMYMEDLRVDIELEGEFTTGMTVGHRDDRFNEKPNAKVGFNIDRDAFVEEVVGAIEKY